MKTVSSQLVPKGRTYLRSVIARVLAGSNNPSAVEELAALRWGHHAAEAITKAAVQPITSSDTFGTTSAAAEFLELVLQQSLLNKIPNLRRVPFLVRMVTMAHGVRGFFVAEGAPLPLSAPALYGTSLRPSKIQSALMATSESLSAVSAEAALQNDLVRALALSIDQIFCSDLPAVADTHPAGICSGAIIVASTGPTAENLRSDLNALFAAFTGDLENAAILMSPETALQIAMLQKPLGTATLGVSGGVLFDVPVLVSQGIEADSSGSRIILLDAGAVGYDVSSIEVSPATHASLEMSDTPNNPATAGTVLVSLWQQNLVALKASVLAAWEVQRTGAAVVLEGVNYGGGS